MKILHADDHTLFCDGLSYILQTLDSNVEVITSSDPMGTLQHPTRCGDLDLVLLDHTMRGINGIEGVQQIGERNPLVPVVVVSGSDNPRDVQAALAAGAAGYIPKSSPTRTLLSALRLVLDGGIYAPRVRVNAAANSEQYESLTPRQFEVLALVESGLPNKSIASQLFITEATVKGHVTAILGMLSVSNRVQAINKAREFGLLRAA